MRREEEINGKKSQIEGNNSEEYKDEIYEDNFDDTIESYEKSI